MTVEATRAEICVVACSDAWRSAGEVLAHAVGVVPTVSARLARMTHNPDLVLTDGECFLMSDPPPLGETAAAGGTVEGWAPFRSVFDILATGRRHSMMGASQIDRFGNQNISCLGPHDRPTRQMFGARGAPGNSVNHRTSYWVARHAPRVFVESVDFVSGVGYDRAVGSAARFHDVHRVVTNLAVLDFDTPDHTMRIASVHPGVTVEQVQQQTGFPLVVPGDVPVTRQPTDEELKLLREVLDPNDIRAREVPE